MILSEISKPEKLAKPQAKIKFKEEEKGPSHDHFNHTQDPIPY
jgi:hypothetical protein